MAYIGITSVADSEQLSPNYIGFQPTFQRPESAFVVDTFTADGSQTVFPLSNPKPTTSRAVLVSVAGYSLVPIIDYDLDQYGNLEFVTAPGSGNAITVHHLIFPKNEATTGIRKLDDISNGFNGIDTRFTLTANGVAANILGANVLVISVNGVIQEPGEAYILDGDDIIFSEAPPTISSFYGIDVGTTGIGTPGDGTISSSKFITDNTASTGKVLGVNSSGELSWVTVGGGVGATDLDGLSDVSLVLPMSGQVLRFNGSNFVNARLNYNDLQGPPSLAAVATSGSYNDLTNTPSYPTDLNGFTDSQGLLFDGDYASLTNLPNIPDHLTDLMDIDVANLTYNQVLVYDGNAWINDSLQLTDLSIVDGTAGQVLTTDGQGSFTFTTVSGGSGSFSGSYNDLTNKPTIPSDVSDLTDTTNLLFSGSYTDLTSKPTIPTKVSDLTNDAGYVTSASGAVPAWTSAGAITLTATTTNPTKGTVTTDDISYRQLGTKQWEVVMTYIQSSVSGGINTGSGDYLVTLPNGLSFDTTLPSQPIYTSGVATSTFAHLPYVIPNCNGTITNNTVGGQIFPMVYNATKFRILTLTYGSGIQCWGSGFYSVGGDLPRIQLTFRFTST